MTCGELRALQTALIEGCIDGGQRLEVEAHLASCATCGRRLERELAVKQAVAGAVSPAPPALRAAILATVPRRHWRAPAVRLAAAVVLTALVAASLVTWARPTGESQAVPDDAVLHAIVADYEREPPGLRAGRPPAVVPDLTAAGLPTWSTSEVGLGQERAEVVRYAGPAGRVAVYRVSRRLARPGGASVAPVSLPEPERTAWSVPDEEYGIVMWTDHASTVVMIGSLPGRELIRIAPRFAGP